MFLKTPDDKEWEIHLTKKDGDIWIHKGWKEFAAHYSLDHGHMLLFQYEKISHFEVHIFNKSTLEIEYHVYGNNQQKHNNTIENLNEQPSCNKTRPKPQISSSQPHKKSIMDTCEEVGTSSKLQNWPKLVQVKGIHIIHDYMSISVSKTDTDICIYFFKLLTILMCHYSCRVLVSVLHCS